MSRIPLHFGVESTRDSPPIKQPPPVCYEDDVIVAEKLSGRTATIALDSEFEHLLQKLNYDQEEVEKMLKFSSVKKQDFLTRYKAFQFTSSARGAASHPLSAEDIKALDTKSVQEIFGKMLDSLDISSNSRHILERKPTLEKRDMITEYLARQMKGPGPESGSSRSRSQDLSPGKSTFTSPSYSPSDKRASTTASVGTPASDRQVSEGYAEKSPQWFTVHISNRNTSLKSLLRHLASLKVSFSLAGPRFIHEFIMKVVAHIGTNGISGISALEIALDRVCAPYLQKRSKQRKRSLPSQTDNSPRGLYSDQVLPDEIRLETMKCVEIIMQTDFGMSCVLLSTGLVRQIVWCYSIPREEVQVEMVNDPRLRRSHLHLITMISQIMGPAALLDAGLKDVILTVMHELQRHQKEPYPFFFLVSSLQHPFSFNRTNATLERSGALDPQYLADYADIWNYRTQMLVFFNGIVSSGDTSSKRSRIRKILESSGLKSIIRTLLDQDPTDEFQAQVESYNEDRQNDLSESEKAFRGNLAEIGYLNFLTLALQ
jgi:hypothetical protein